VSPAIELTAAVKCIIDVRLPSLIYACVYDLDYTVMHARHFLINN